MSVVTANRTEVAPMTCRHCEKDATVVAKEMVGGYLRDVEVCEECARGRGLTLSSKPGASPIDLMVEKMIVANVGELAGELANLRCPVCSMKFMEYRSTGRLGCPYDYIVFSKGILTQLTRTQGASRHVGKVARQRPASFEKLRLRTLLRDAIAREDYEAAARFRDQLRLKDADE